MRVLVACEYSGLVRDAFLARGHDALSCDFEPTERPGPHYQGDVRDLLRQPWDLMIGHPPCTFLSNSSSKHLYIDGKKENGRDHQRWNDMRDGAAFFAFLWGQSTIPRICLENPIMLGYAKALTGAGKQTQTIQPWQHGTGEQKATCLWLKNLPLLVPSNVVSGRVQKCHKQGRARRAGKSEAEHTPASLSHSRSSGDNRRHQWVNLSSSCSLAS